MQLLPDVYPFAAYLGRQFGCKYIIGVGEAAAEHLIDFHPEFEVIGFVHEVNLQMYRTQYPFGTWLDLNNPGSRGIPLADHILDRAIIVCPNLIEEFVRPIELLEILKSWLDHAPVCILTAAENQLHGKRTSPGGSPETHQGGWRLEDLEALLQAQGLNVEFIGLIASDDVTYEKKTILAVMTGDTNSTIRKRAELKTPTDFRVVAFMAAYNEEDIIVQSIKKWTDQGVDVHVLENWSTDATYDLLKELETRLPVTIERFPAHGPSNHFDWGAMLARIEALSREIKADWFVRRGADEVLMSPWPGVSYRDSLYLLDLAGFNCVDHTAINFYPVDDAFPAGADYEAYFRHFAFGTNKADFQQRKTWKNYGQPVSMVGSGGHDLPFAGRRIFPFKFLLKHYPVRSQKHGEKKIFGERKARWNPEERAKGWHDHYDAIEEDHAFVHSPSALQAFEEAQFNKSYLVERLSGIGVIRGDREAAHRLRMTVQELTLRLAEREAQLESVQEFTLQLRLSEEAQLETVQELTLRLGEQEAQLRSVQELTLQLRLSEEAQLETAGELTLRLAEKDAQLEHLQELTLKLRLSEEAQLGTAQQLALRLAEKETQLEKISNSLGWRLLSHFGPIKYRFMLPAYKTIQKLFGGKLPQGSDSKKRPD
jgi:hypothetical protein